MAVRPVALRRLAVIVTLLLAARQSPGASLDWRFWTSADGMRESYTRLISMGADGRIWMRHGAVDAMSIFDGFAVTLHPGASRWCPPGLGPFDEGVCGQ